MQAVMSDQTNDTRQARIHSQPRKIVCLAVGNMILTFQLEVSELFATFQGMALRRVSVFTANIFFWARPNKFFGATKQLLSQPTICLHAVFANKNCTFAIKS